MRKKQPTILYSSSKAQKFITYNSWTDYVYSIQEGTIGNKLKNIFRGQSNFTEGGAACSWGIKSYFNRTFKGVNFLENKYAEYRNIKNYFKLYKTSFAHHLGTSISFVDILQFFQHYSIPTPLIDFTSDPLTALYFALCPIPSFTIGKFGDEIDRFITIVEIDLDSLVEQGFEISESKNDDVKSFLNHEIDTDNYNQQLKKIKSRYNRCFKRKKFVIDFFLTPNIQINPNLFRQKGVFMYLDSIETFEDILEQTVIDNKVSLSKPFLIKHHIPYKSCFVTPKNKCLNVFSYLQFKQKTGIFLFENDVQGLKYDSLNGNFTYPLDCLGKIQDCECRELLINNNILC